MSDTIVKCVVYAVADQAAFVAQQSSEPVVVSAWYAYEALRDMGYQPDMLAVRQMFINRLRDMGWNVNGNRWQVTISRG